MPDRRILGFVHIEKTAGTSMIHILRHNNFMQYMDVRPLYNRQDDTFTARDLELTLRINPFIRAIGGHSVVPHSDLEKVAKIDYITLLRSPVKRYISQYRYWGAALGRNMSPEKFLSKKSEHNLQVVKIAGEPNVQKAIDMLESRFVCFGVVERFEPFIQRLMMYERERGHSFDPISIRTNITGMTEYSERDLMGKYEEQIVLCNALDIELYEYVIKRIEEGIGETPGVKVNKISRPTSKLYIDYIMRKLYYVPVSGLIRMAHGMRFKGSYSEAL